MKMMQAYEIYYAGNYASINADCSQAFLTLGTSQINDSEIVCDIKGIKQDEDDTLILVGKKCSAEGHKLANFTFAIKHDEVDTIIYKNSGETIWQKLKLCPTEKRKQL